ncbi:MAG: PAS domain S-box protein, partial [Cyanobacteria bacterium J06639_1]
MTANANQVSQEGSRDRAEFQADLERLFELSLDLLCVAGSDGYLKRLSPSFAAVTGYAEAELLAKPYAEFIHPDDLAVSQQAIARLQAGEAIANFTNRWVGKSGAIVWLEWTVTPDTTETGLRLYCAARDITERKRTETQWLRVQAAVESLSDAVGIADATGTPVYLNPAFEATFGYTLEELIAVGGPVVIYDRPDDRDAVFARILQGESWVGEVPMRDRRGTRLQIALRADAIRDETGAIVGLV